MTDAEKAALCDTLAVLASHRPDLTPPDPFGTQEDAFDFTTLRTVRAAGWTR